MAGAGVVAAGVEAGVVAAGVVAAVVGAGVEAPDEAVAITGDAGEPDGVELTMPVAAVLFGYGVHVSVSVLPETFSAREMAGSTVRLMAPPVAVKGPTDAGVEGNINVRPVAGTGLGIGALMTRLPLEIEAGVAPVASTLVTAVPAMAEFPSAAAADTMDVGRATMDWYPVRLNVAPAAGAAGVMVPDVTTLFNTMLPTGVFGQYSSYGEEAANADGAAAANSANMPPAPASPTTTAATARPLRLDLAIIPPLFGDTCTSISVASSPVARAGCDAPPVWARLAGTMTREGVRPQHLLGTLRSRGLADIIRIDDFLPNSLWVLTCTNVWGRAKTRLTVA